MPTTRATELAQVGSLVTADPSTSTVTVGGTLTATTVTLPNNSVTTTSINDSAVTTAKINDSAVTNAKLASPYIGFKNRIINGDMRIDQRNVGAAITINSTNLAYDVDRWKGVGQSADGVFTLQQVTDAPAKFNNSLKATVTTADASVGASQFYNVFHAIEGFNIVDLGWGASGASTVTLSFWAKSSLTGTMGGSLYNSDANYCYPFTYSISSANTWEYKNITITGATSGTWLVNNNAGINVNFSLGDGSNRLATAGSWTTNVATGATGQTQVISTLNATIQWTGVQLEVGSTATDFERRPYETELALCQRYYEKSYNIDVKPNTLSAYGVAWNYIIVNGTTISQMGVTAYFKTTKRANPTMIWYSPDSVPSNGYVGTVGGTQAAITAWVGMASAAVYWDTTPNGNAQVRAHYTADAEL